MIFYYFLSKLCSKITRFITHFYIPTILRPFIFQTFAHIFGVNLSEVEKPLKQYRSFDAFFTRDLTQGARTIDKSPTCITSPVDGVVLESTDITNGTLIQAKGVTYTLKDLCPIIDTTPFKGGSFTTIYLSPKDCHNIYAPYNGTLTDITHVPGKLYPVREPYISQFDNLYTKNERLNLYFDTQHGKMAVILVGAFNVGTMTTPLDPTFYTNTYTLNITHRDISSYKAVGDVRKGDKIGTFHLGSTVIILTEKKHQHLKNNQIHVQIGQPLLQLNQQ